MIFSVRVHLWDLSGGSEYIDVRNEMYSGTDIIFLMFDVTNSGSFEGLEMWMKEITKYANPQPEICVVANKVGFVLVLNSELNSSYIFMSCLL